MTLPKRTPPIERIARRTEVDANGCHLWNGAVNRDGYGLVMMHIDGRKRNRFVHRVIYEAHSGPIPGGLEIDHLCRNRRCCNPAHLEAVDQAENKRRGSRSLLTHCKSGHPFDGENLSVYVSKGGVRRRRSCRACMVKWTRDYLQRKAEKSHVA